jgi:hypothetical protein
MSALLFCSGGISARAGMENIRIKKKVLKSVRIDFKILLHAFSCAYLP